ncbi:MAG: kynureninase [Flavobacteriales bacterium]|nr:kynureninase [Flavobacteriales bacterium]
MEFQNTPSFAASLDAQDQLASYRQKFFFPQHDGKNVLYFTGNSLGLQPSGVREALMQECDDWAHFGVEAHHHAKTPWYAYHEIFADGAAKLVGALPEEVVVMNQLTVNLQLLLISFYQPKGKRNKILFETKPFPSDHYAFESQARLHGLKSDDVLVEMQPREGEYTLRTEDIISKIHELEDELALVCFGGVNYFSGQFFDIAAITKAAHEVGAIAGFDLAHAAGNLPLHLHDWNVDFACWCTYKYLNSGPGSVAGAFINQKHVKNTGLPRLAGWWGHNKETRFAMKPGFDPMLSAESWQLSNAPVFAMAVHKVALDIFTEVGMEKLRAKSIQLTAYLAFILNEVEKNTGEKLSIITPKNVDERGCHLSVIFPGRDKSLVQKLSERGATVDWREPNVMRIAPVPLYNSFGDVYSFGQILQEVLQSK